MFIQFDDVVPFYFFISLSFLDILNVDFLNIFGMFLFFSVCVISHFCVQEDCDVNKYFYGTLSHL